MALLQGDIDNHALLIKYSLYIVMGVLAGSVNISVAIALWRSPSLRRRKEYVVIGGLALADGLDGLATAMAGMYRVVGISLRFATDCVPVLSCMVLPQTILLHWAGVAAAFMLLAVSADRLFAVLFPMTYFRSGVAYATRLVLAVVILSFFHLSAAWIEPLLNHHKTLRAICDTAALSPVYYVYSKYATATMSFASVLVYSVVVRLLSRRMTRLCSLVDAQTLVHQLRVQGQC
uniref:G-protein coupled receptors family 1 profile domain-containing protein n=1 Tax=Plectus sambesii TaxID=2011161 RepID=A0A914V2W1_9BILA